MSATLNRKSFVNLYWKRSCKRKPTWTVINGRGRPVRFWKRSFREHTCFLEILQAQRQQKVAKLWQRLPLQESPRSLDLFPIFCLLVLNSPRVAAIARQATGYRSNRPIQSCDFMNMKLCYVKRGKTAATRYEAGFSEIRLLQLCMCKQLLIWCHRVQVGCRG